MNVVSSSSSFHTSLRFSKRHFLRAQHIDLEKPRQHAAGVRLLAFGSERDAARRAM
jgi:hypothetical protein